MVDACVNQDASWNLMMQVLRAITGIVVGMMVLIILLIAVEFYSSIVHPVPSNFGNTPAEMCEHVARYPAWVLASVVPLWAIASLASGWTALRLGNRFSFATVSFLIVAGLVMNVSMLPYPMWFKIAILMVIPLVLVAVYRSSSIAIQ